MLEQSLLSAKISRSLVRFVPHLQRTGRSRARECSLLSDAIDSRAAGQLGLVNRVIGFAHIETVTSGFAQTLAARSAAALAAVNANLDAAFKKPYRHALAEEARNFSACRESKDHLEAVRAFILERKTKARQPGSPGSCFGTETLTP